MKPLRVGLTGGIGSGKTTVAHMFADLGIAVLDLDQVGRQLVAPGSPGLAQLIQTFGKVCLDSDGSLDRAALAQHCFSSATETAKLNGLMHPLIIQAEEQWVRLQDSPYVMIEASVLLESGGVSRMDKLVVVLADEALRYTRVMQRGDRIASEFHDIVARQCSDELRRDAAEIIIENMHSLEALRYSVGQSHEILLDCMAV